MRDLREVVIVAGTGCACCSYSEWRGQSALVSCSTETEQLIYPPPGPSEQLSGPDPSAKGDRQRVTPILLTLSHTPACTRTHTHTAFPRLPALGMCSRSTQGWEKNWVKVRRVSGSLSSSRSSKSLQFLDTLAPAGSWDTQHNQRTTMFL
jgi:hypothetical protein